MQTEPQRALEIVTEMVKERYTHDSTQQAPMVFVFKDTQVATIVQLDFDNDTSKSLSIQAVREVVGMVEADACVFVSEGWSVAQPTVDEITMRPSEHPARVEVLLIEVSSPNQKAMRYFEIKRDASDHVIDLAEQESITNVTSRFSFFENETVH